MRRSLDAYTAPVLLVADTGHYEKSDLPPPNRSDHSLMQTQIEFKSSAENDPFIDPGPESQSSNQKYPFENTDVEAIYIRGQIAGYAGITLYLSFRTHLFTVFVSGQYCRFIRWDRRGAVVTRRIDYTKEPKVLFAFYHRFAQLTRTERGLDPTVTNIDQNSEEASSAKRCFSRYSEDMRHCDGKVGVEPESGVELNPVLLKMTVVFEGVERFFIIPSPRFYLSCLSPFSRSTRRSLAYDPTAKGKDLPELLFMKDYWREDSNHTAPEATIYKLLEQKGVKEHIAEMDVGGDIPGLKTRWQENTFGDFSLFPNSKTSNYSALQGHRIFLKTIAMDLTTFLKARWLVTCIADGMEAAQEAFSQARVLHRDISVGNIMIILKDNDERRGVLIDWDHCIILKDKQSPSQMLRTGTWQFMSAHLLQGINHSHSALDDRESAYWVLLYMALRFLKNSLSPHHLSQTILQLFDKSFEENDGRMFGGTTKADHLEHNTRFRDIQFDIPQLVDMFNELANELSARYLSPPSESDLELHRLVIKGEDPQLINVTPAGKYYAAHQYLSDKMWFIKTLRKHAEKIPLPSPQTSPSNGSKRTYDYHHNYTINNPARGRGVASERHYQSANSTSRLDGLAGGLRPLSGTSLKRGVDDEPGDDGERKRMEKAS
ncbi:hypothetical protein BDZ94DRAFT_1191989 [Collybia nuda]|uniref:Fungal-type protein kinase domain-containing protein n=1 Tax=Collybia nuda TaxID=64659 RepID=A0A9P5Y712_9AGAR|nr:hypothetical protein BDZ94DRAFT_1191989 [Collybia nuda]